MPYKTSQGRTVEYPMALAAKAAKSTDDAREIVDKTFSIFREMQNLDIELITLREENKRLKHENEFMLRLINDRSQ